MKLKVELSFEQKAPTGLAHLGIVVGHIVLGDALHDYLVVGGLDVAHPVEQPVDVGLAHAVELVGRENVVLVARAAHELSEMPA